MVLFLLAKKLDSLGEWLNQYLPTLEYYVAVKKDGVLYTSMIYN